MSLAKKFNYFFGFVVVGGKQRRINTTSFEDCPSGTYSQAPDSRECYGCSDNWEILEEHEERRLKVLCQIYETPFNYLLVGLIVGSLLVFILLGIMCFFCCKKLKQRNENRGPQQNN